MEKDEAGVVIPLSEETRARLAAISGLTRGGIIPSVNERQRVKRRQRLWRLGIAGGRR